MVNVSSKALAPNIYFYDQNGNPIESDLVVDMDGDMKIADDGALTVRTDVQPLGELTIITSGQGAVMTGSVRVLADGLIGGVLRFNAPGIGVAGVGASAPLNDVIFPARRQEGGINTGTAIRNLGENPIQVSCQSMKEGAVLEATDIPLSGNGQTAKFIHELFPQTDTFDFVGSVRCTASEGERFAGVALEMDANSQIFTTLPMVPVPQ